MYKKRKIIGEYRERERETKQRTEREGGERKRKIPSEASMSDVLSDSSITFHPLNRRREAVVERSAVWNDVSSSRFLRFPVPDVSWPFISRPSTFNHSRECAMDLDKMVITRDRQQIYSSKRGNKLLIVRFFVFPMGVRSLIAWRHVASKINHGLGMYQERK